MLNVSLILREFQSISDYLHFGNNENIKTNKASIKIPPLHLKDFQNKPRGIKPSEFKRRKEQNEQNDDIRPCFVIYNKKEEMASIKAGH
jgi:hypothetical protein